MTGTISSLLNPYKLASILAVVLILAGLTQRRKKHVHIPLMLTAFLIDISIVVAIELTRGAVASARAKMGPLMVVHIIISVLVLVLYAVQIVSGVRKARGRPGRWHGYTGISFVLLRLGNLVTSYLVT
jgi:hypothetical protein